MTAPCNSCLTLKELLIQDLHSLSRPRLLSNMPNDPVPPVIRRVAPARVWALFVMIQSEILFLIKAPTNDSPLDHFSAPKVISINQLTSTKGILLNQGSPVKKRASGKRTVQIHDVQLNLAIHHAL